jgi:hypothetical protein
VDVVERAVASYLTDTREGRAPRRRALLALLDKLNDESLSYLDRLTAVHERMRGEE